MTDRWSKFWWQDYEGDDALRVCSLAAQGLWMRMLCAMHKGTPYGHLTVNGRPATVRQIAAIASAPEKEVAKLLAELAEAGVYSVDGDDVMFCRRMVRDKAAREKFSAYGKTGGNPALKAEDNPTDNGGGNPGGLTPPLKHQEAEAEAEAEKTPPTPRSGGRALAAEFLPDWLPVDSWADWCQFRRGKTWTPKAVELSIQNLEKLRHEGHDPRAVIEQSIANGWRGLFAIKRDQRREPVSRTAWVYEDIERERREREREPHDPFTIDAGRLLQ